MPERRFENLEELQQPESPNQENSENLSRRDFLKSLGAMALSASPALKGAESLLSGIPEQEQDIKPQARLRTYPTRELKGRKLGGLYTWYTGIDGLVPGKVKINFALQLDSMWKEKIRKFPVNKEMLEQIRSSLLNEYRGTEALNDTLQGYVNRISGVLESVRNDLNWGRVAELKNLTASELELVRELVNSISSRDMIAYTLTELMPSEDGELNCEVLEFLTKNAGIEYLYKVPAMSDKFASFGPYQMTQYAWYDTGKNARGGSQINKCLKKQKVPHGSVAKLKGDQHHKAAYLFMIDNIIRLINGLDAQQAKFLKNNWGREWENIIQFLGVAHHAPSAAPAVAKDWLKSQGQKSFAEFCVGKYGRLRPYAQKTAANYRAIRKFTRELAG